MFRHHEVRKIVLSLQDMIELEMSVKGMIVDVEEKQQQELG